METFHAEDFAVYAPNYQANEEWNGKRLAIRRKLEAFGKLGVEIAKAANLTLEARTSLHHPFEFNNFHVRQQWVYLTRNKKEKSSLKKLLGPELGKDLDSAYRNLNLNLSIDEQGMELALKIHPDAWFDGQNLKNKCSVTNFFQEWLQILNCLPGFEFRIHDWKKIYDASSTNRTDLQDFLKYYIPGEHRFTLYQRLDRDDPLATSPDFVDWYAECMRLLAPAYHFVAWSLENDYLNLKV